MFILCHIITPHTILSYYGWKLIMYRRFGLISVFEEKMIDQILINMSGTGWIEEFLFWYINLKLLLGIVGSTVRIDLGEELLSGTIY